MKKRIWFLFLPMLLVLLLLVMPLVALAATALPMPVAVQPVAQTAAPSLILIWVAIAAMIGGIINAILGWVQTKDPFDARKFTSSCIASFIGAIVIAVGFNYIEGNLLAVLFSAFLSGAGVSAGASRIAGSIAKPPG